jgi:threonine dehydratase
VGRTPLLTSRSLSERIGVEVRIKCENLQRAGSFKVRGALNALLQIPEADRSRGVVAFSSGNHAQGVALAAGLLGIPATIVMPEGSVLSKVQATEDRVIAGAGTVAWEIVEEWADVTTIVTPLGGGGLLAGTALAATSLRPDIEVFGVEPAAGNDGEQSFRAGRIITIEPPQTIADGARTLAIGERNFAIIRERVKNVVSVEDDVLLEHLRWTMYRTKLVIEPTGALGVAALLEGKIRPRGPVAVVVSGGNLDFQLLCR